MSTTAKVERPTTLEKTAAILKVNPRTLAGWLERGCPGKADDGTYSPTAIREWHTANVRVKQPSAGREDVPNLTAARAREVQARAELTETKLARAKGESLSRHDALMIHTSTILLARAYIDNLPDVIVARVRFPSDASRHRARAAVEKAVADFWQAMTDGLDQLIRLAQKSGAPEFSDEDKAAMIEAAEAEVSALIDAAGIAPALSTNGEADE